MTIDQWRHKGQFIEIDGHSIFYLDINSGTKDTIAILHGYPSCSFDYHKIFRYLNNYRIVIHDQLGFGLSDKPLDNEYLLSYQAEIVCKLWEKLEIPEIHLVAHDYGTSVATALLSRDQEKGISVNIKTLTLCNGSMLIDMANLRLIQRLLKNKWLGAFVANLASYRTFKRNMRNIVAKSSSFSEEELELLWKLLLHNNGRKVLPKITKYIDQRYWNYEKWIGALEKTKLKTLILWGDKDPVAIYEMAIILHEKIQNAQLCRLTGTGHYPMIEQAHDWSEAIIKHIEN